jgi:hypothetical protein
VEITAAVAADLTALTQALDEPGADLAVLLHQLAADAKFAVATFVGLTVRVTVDDHPSNLTAFEADAAVDKVRASVLIPMQHGADGAGIDLVLYASAPGAFTDLAADLAWLSGRALSDFLLDQHLAVPERDRVDGADRPRAHSGAGRTRTGRPIHARWRGAPHCRPADHHRLGRCRFGRVLGVALSVLRLSARSG